MGQSTANCVQVFDRPGGIKTSQDLREGLSLALGDVASGRMTNGSANALCNLAGKILYTVKLEEQYGSPVEQGARRVLSLVGGEGPVNSLGA